MVHTKSFITPNPLILVYLFLLLGCHPKGCLKTPLGNKQSKVLGNKAQFSKDLKDSLLQADKEVLDREDKMSELTGSSQELERRLLQALEENDVELVALLIQKGVEVNVKDEDGYTPLHCAAYKNSTATAALLIQKGAQINAQDKYSWTPLHWAADNNSTAMAALLIQKGADIHAQDISGQTPLHWAARNNSTATAALLLKSGANVNAQDNRTLTPLHWTAYKNSAATAAILLKSDADINAKNKYGQTPLQTAVEFKCAEVEKLLRANGGR